MTEPNRRSRLLVLGAGIGFSAALILVALILFVPAKDKTKSHTPTPAGDPSSVITHQIHEEEFSASYFEISNEQPLETTKLSTNTSQLLQSNLFESPPRANEPIAVGAQVEVDMIDVALCTVATPGALLDYIRNVPECQTVYLLDLVTYAMPETMYINRPITIVGNPLALPNFVPLGIPHLFRVVEGGRLDLRFVQVLIAAFSLRPVFIGLFITISGAIAYVEERGPNRT